MGGSVFDNHFADDGSRFMRKVGPSYVIKNKHEHHAAFLLKAKSHEEATTIAKSQEHEPTILDDMQEPTCWDYGDGTTASRLLGVVEITLSEAATLERLGIAFYFHWENEERYKKRVQCSDNSTFEDCLTVGKSYDVAVEKNDGGKDMDMYYLLDDNNEPLNALSWRFAE